MCFGKQEALHVPRSRRVNMHVHISVHAAINHDRMLKKKPIIFHSKCMFFYQQVHKYI